MFNIIAIAMGVLIAGILGFAATKPNTLHVERAISVKAPPEKIYPMIEDFHRWNSWSPYEKKDLAMKRTFGGSPSGKGAVYEWNGNRNVGSGRMEIADTVPASKVSIKLDFLAPFEGHNVADFTLEPKGDSTFVKWAMHGPNSFMGKLMSVFINMDDMIGKDFESGLANMKTLAEN